MKIISQITYKGLEINFMDERNPLDDKCYIGYSFGYKGKNYGQKVALKRKGTKDIMETTLALFVNACESFEGLKKNKPKKEVKKAVKKTKKK